MLRLAAGRRDARLDAEDASGAQRRMEDDAQLDERPALDAGGPPRQLLLRLETGEQVHDAVRHAPDVLEQLHLACRIAFPRGHGSPADLDEPHLRDRLARGAGRLARRRDAARSPVLWHRAARRMSRWWDRPRRTVAAAELELGEERRQDVPVQAVADLRVQGQPVALFGRERGFDGQRRGRARLLEKANVLGPDAGAGTGPIQRRRCEPDRLEHGRQALIRLRQVEADVEVVVLVALPRVDAAAVAGDERHQRAPDRTTSMR